MNVVIVGKSAMIATICQAIHDAGIDVAVATDPCVFEIKRYAGDGDFPAWNNLKRERDYPSLREGLRNPAIKNRRR